MFDTLATEAVAKYKWQERLQAAEQGRLAAMANINRDRTSPTFIALISEILAAMGRGLEEQWAAERENVSLSA